jgi:hypothetical protein
MTQIRNKTILVIGDWDLGFIWNLEFDIWDLRSRQARHE